MTVRPPPRFPRETVSVECRGLLVIYVRLAARTYSEDSIYPSIEWV